MENYVHLNDFLPVIESRKEVVVSTNYNRDEKTTPFVNSSILSQLKTKGYKVEKLNRAHAFKIKGE